MFEKRYITKGISSEIPICLQNLMWLMIDSMEVSKKDYLQVFMLERVDVYGKTFQKITHSQEQPEYKNSMVVPVDEKEVFEGKVFVIDDVSHCTMLLAEEY